MTVTYAPAPAVEKIAVKLIREHHEDLEDVDIIYVFRSEPAKKAGKVIAGEAKKKTGLDAWLYANALEDGSVDDPADFFVIEIARTFWDHFDAKQRIALVDHELCHCITELDKDENVVLKMVGHDVEEFRCVIERHGLWEPDLEAFAKSIEEARRGQPSLLDDLDEDDDTKVTVSFGDRSVETTVGEMEDLADDLAGHIGGRVPV